MKVDLQLNGRPEDAAARAKELVALAGAYDVFVPLVIAEMISALKVDQ